VVFPTPAAAALPAQPGPLIGRTTELRLVRSRLTQPDARLLTLVGPAGTGKTRLAVEVASHAAAAFADGTFFVDLAPVHDAALVPSAIAKALDIREEGDRSLLDVLKERLSTRQTLLLLDNFEQVLGAAIQLSDLVQTCPQLKLLVTSRSALRLRWEHVLVVPPLDVPNAVELFAQRAQRANPQFSLLDENRAAVEKICVRLDGLPLAIELAAARSRVLPPQALLSRLEHRLDILETSAADRPTRQRTLRAALDWSYELLTEPEQAIFRRLGVFVGGFPLGAFGEVCDPDGALGLDGLAAVESLLDKSLLRPEPAAAQTEPRFGMLETLREYALERLRDSGEEAATLRRHACYYLVGADVPVAEMKLAQQKLWLQSLDAEHDNLRAALDWCQAAGEPQLGLSAASLLAWFWIVRGYVTEGRRWLTALLETAADAPPELRAEALRVIGSLALHQSDYAAAKALFEASLAIRRGLGQPAGLISALSSLGAVAMQQGEIENAEHYFAAALDIQTRIEDSVGIAESLNNLANLAHERGDLPRARELYERSLSVQQLGARYRADVVLHNLGVVAQEQGDLPGARRHFEDSVALRRALGDTAGLALSLAKLGEVMSSMGDAHAAHRLLCESLTLQRDFGDRAGMAFSLERLAMAAAVRGQPRQALRIAAAAEGLREAIGTPLGPGARAILDRWLAAARAELRPDDAAAAWETGKALKLDQVVAEAMQFDAIRPNASRAADPVSQLSPREREVAALVAQGLTNRDIAERLVVSERTAENHVQHVLNRLGLRSRAQVAAWAVQHGLLKINVNQAAAEPTV
jgi:predicted ATPase/DNA-binding CsgD family transcriptional regulator/Tfp pilus assembly protein PilF